MNKSIWKFPLETVDEQTVEMPENADILSIQIQHGKLCLWALVNPEAKKVHKVFHVFGTGHPVPEADMKFIGTYQLEGGNFVGHLFEML